MTVVAGLFLSLANVTVGYIFNLSFKKLEIQNKTNTHIHTLLDAFHGLKKYATVRLPVRYSRGDTRPNFIATWTSVTYR